MSLNDFQNHMEIISDYMTAEVWVVSPDGEILLDSSDPEIGKRSNDTVAGSSPYIIKDFDITDFGNSYYTVGKFYNEFSSDQLSVFSSITEGYQTRAYIILHKDMSSVTDGINGFLNISFYTVAFIFLLAFLILALFVRAIYRPLIKITESASRYAKGDFTSKLISTQTMNSDIWQTR